MFVQPAFERHRLLAVELGEVPVAGRVFEPCEGSGDPVDGRIVTTPRLLQILEIGVLQAGIPGVVFGHGGQSFGLRQFREGHGHSSMCRAASTTWT